MSTFIFTTLSSFDVNTFVLLNAVFLHCSVTEVKYQSTSSTPAPGLRHDCTNKMLFSFLQSWVVCKNTEEENVYCEHATISDENEASDIGLTKHDEAGVSVCGAQRILGRAAEHGAVEFSRDSVQDQFPSIVLLAAVQQTPSDPGPGEHGLREDLALWTRR